MPIKYDVTIAKSTAYKKYKHQLISFAFERRTAGWVSNVYKKLKTILRFKNTEWDFSEWNQKINPLYPYISSVYIHFRGKQNGDSCFQKKWWLFITIFIKLILIISNEIKALPDYKLLGKWVGSLILPPQGV